MKVSKEYFKSLCDHFLSQLREGEHANLELTGENTQFIRFNRARVRQIGTVSQFQMGIEFITGKSTDGPHRSTSGSFDLSGDEARDREALNKELKLLREEIAHLPLDPYVSLPQKWQEDSDECRSGNILSPSEATEALLSPLGDIDFTGIYMGGELVRASSNSAGQFHWFDTHNMAVDYSIYTDNERCLKSEWTGSQWDGPGYQEQIAEDKRRLDRLHQKPIAVKPGSYRVFLEPAAMAEILSMFSWSCISEASVQQGDSPLRHLRSGFKFLSSHFTLAEDFSFGDTPRFNAIGQLAPVKNVLIDSGKLQSTLICTRSAKEYGLESNGANNDETLRAPVVSVGSIAKSHVLDQLGTGIYISNLHYLGWSDPSHGRLTGMTRYACFWVENGQLVGPIENLRFDDSLFNLLGESLVGFTDTQQVFANLDTYDHRRPGSTRTPGALISSMAFKL